MAPVIPKRDAIIPSDPVSLGVSRRRSVAALIIDERDTIIMATVPAMVLLKRIAPAMPETPEGHALPEDLAQVMRVIRRELNADGLASSVTPLPQGLCFRASLIGGDHDIAMLILIEEAGRGEASKSFADAKLTAREREVAQRVVRGLSNRQIAVELGLTGYTVESHLKRIFVKMHVGTRAALAAAMLGSLDFRRRDGEED